MEPGPRARLVSVTREPQGTYKAIVEVDLPGEPGAPLVLEHLARKPAQAKARWREGLLVVELLDEKGEGFASCPIDPQARAPPWKCSPSKL